MTTPIISSLSATARASSSSSRVPAYIIDQARGPGPAVARRGIHVSASTLKDNKRWVNAAAEEEDAKKVKQGEEASKKNEEAVKEEEKKEVKDGEQAESSKAAQDRAAKAAEETKSTTAESTSAASASGTTASASSTSDASSQSSGKEIAKINVPDVFPRVLALPITLRPLFPTFYKAVTITHPPVIKAIRELLAHGQPYIGAFLFKDSESDADVITSLDQVHPVGVFAQITSTFEPPDKNKSKDGKDITGAKAESAEPKALTVVLFPHRRIRIDELVFDPSKGDTVPLARVVEEVQKDQVDEGEVLNFERDVPSVDAVRESLGTPPAEPESERRGKPVASYLYVMLTASKLSQRQPLRMALKSLCPR